MSYTGIDYERDRWRYLVGYRKQGHGHEFSIRRYPRHLGSGEKDFFGVVYTETTDGDEIARALTRLLQIVHFDDHHALRFVGATVYRNGTSGRVEAIDRINDMLTVSGEQHPASEFTLEPPGGRAEKS